MQPNSEIRICWNWITNAVHCSRKINILKKMPCCIFELTICIAITYLLMIQKQARITLIYKQYEMLQIKSFLHLYVQHYVEIKRDSLLRKKMWIYLYIVVYNAGSQGASRRQHNARARSRGWKLSNKFIQRRYSQETQTRTVLQDSKRGYTSLNIDLSFEVSIQARVIWDDVKSR
jgi:hypothetical protein